MRAQAGDWLIVEQANIDHEARLGLIEEVRTPDGTPPYLVRWLDTGHEALVFPGPDAHVQPQEEFAAAGARAFERAAEVQRQIVARRRGA
jgi:Domain of unknown function (DUF1918)